MLRKIIGPAACSVFLVLLLLVASCTKEGDRATGGSETAPAGKLELVVKDSPPQLIRYIRPTYPREALVEAPAGTVVVRVLVKKDGTVGEAVVKEGVHSDLDLAANIAARRCGFIPARREGEMVEEWTTIRFGFQAPR